jgi:acetoin utilization deacetylase AcuC-like enzyme
MRAFFSDHFVLPLPPEHRFPMAKYRLLRERLIADGIVPLEHLIEPPAADWEELRLVHTQAYLDAIANGTLPYEAQRRIGFPWSPAFVERARRSVGATILAARAALDDGAAANLAGGTHHAFSHRGEGYCVFNDVAVAARVLQRDGAVARMLVVDLDVHQGNGTAAIFRDEPAVFTFSIHGASNFPFQKETSDLDIALPDGTGDDDYLDVLAQHLPTLIETSRPDLVFYVSGADPYEGDRLGRLKLTIEGLRARDALVFDTCRAADLPVAVSMGGGYATNVDDIVTIHANTVREAARHAMARPRALSAGSGVSGGTNASSGTVAGTSGGPGTSAE